MSKKINFKTISDRAVKAAGLAGGVAVSRIAGVAIGKVLDKYMTSSSDATKKFANSSVRILAGAVLPALVGNKKSSLVDNVADGILADGAASMGGVLKIPGLSGVDDDDNLSGAYDALSYAAQQDLVSYGGSSNVSGQD